MAPRSPLGDVVLPWLRMDGPERRWRVSLLSE